MQPWFIAYMYFNIGHPCYGQLTPIKSQYSLTSIMLPYCRLKFRAHGNHIFLKLLLTKCCSSFGLLAHARLTCCNQSRVVWMLADANPGLT